MPPKRRPARSACCRTSCFTGCSGGTGRRVRHWAALSGELAPRQALQLLVLDEGVAHFVHREERLSREGFPRERAGAAFAALASAWQRLARAEPASSEAEDILRSANQGSYWDKYGSISGMLLSYGVSRRFGAEGIREAVRCGPGRLLSLYARAAAGHPDLPPLPEVLPESAWLDLCRRAR